MAIKRSFILSTGIGVSADNLFVVNNTNSVSSTTGSIVLSGGIGIGQSASISGRLQMFNGANYTSFVSSASGNTVYTLPATSPATGSSVLQSTSAGVLSWVPMTATGGAASGNTAQNIVVNSAGNASAFHPILFTPASLSAGSAVSSDGTISFNPSTDILSVSGLAVTNTTASTSSTTGALIVSGGAGIAKTSYFAQDVKIQGSTASTTPTTGALVVTGGVGIGGKLNVGTATTAFTPTDVIASFARNVAWYDDATYASVAIQNTNSDAYSGVQLSLRDNLAAEGTITFWNSHPSNTGFSNGLEIAGPADIFYRAGPSSSFRHGFTGGYGVNIEQVTVSTSTTSGSLVVNGGAGIAKTSYFGQSVVVQGTTASGSTTTGALTVAGGVGIGGSIFGGSTISAAGNIEIKSGKELRLNNSGNTFYTGIKTGANTSNTTYTFPVAFPGSGTSILQSDTSGVLAWVPMTAGAASGNTAQNIVVNTAGNANVFHPVLFTPSSLSAGSAVSSDSTISFNPSTEILNVSGLAITSGTASTNTTTGALVVRGGLGVTGQLSFAQASFGFTGITTNPIMSFIGATSSSPITLTVLTDNSLSFEGSQGSVFSIDSNLSSGEIFSVSDISGLPIISASAGQTVNINEFGGFTQIGNGSINSSSTTTGSLVVAGGMGVTGNANIGGTVRITNTTNSFSTTTGALVVNGGVGITGNAFIGGIVNVTNTTAATGVSTAALVVSGGLGVQGDLFVAANANTKLSIMQSSGDEGGEIFLNKPVTNTTITNGVTIDVFQNRLRIFEQGGSARGFYLDITTGGNGVATNIMGGSSSGTVNSGTANYAAFYPASSNAVSENANLQFTGTGISIGGNIASTSTTSGSLWVYGGVGIGQSVSVGGRLQMFNGANYTAFVSSATGNTVYTLPATSPATGSSVLQSTSAGVMSWVAMSSGSSSGGVTDGSVQYKSGSGFASTNSFFYDTTLYALRLSNFPAGEATSSTSAALKVEQTTGSFNGSLNGTMIAVNANSGFTGDLFNLQSNAITKFRVDANGAIGTSSDIVTVSTTASTNTTSGALQVRGGAGIAQSLFVGGALNVGTDLIISGLTTLTYTSEKLTTKTSATGTVTHDLSTGSIFYHSSISNNFTANITNVPTTNDRAIGVTLVLAQGVTPYMSTALQIDGSAQTIKWVNNITPTGTASKVDIVGFSLIRTGSAWTVLGQYSTYG
jgi:hypothetical protein